jgi:hypothetical protein
MNMKSDRDVCESLASMSGGSEWPKKLAPAAYPVPGRTSEMNHRITIHEAGHAYVGCCMGSKISSVSIVRGDGFEGRCLSKAYEASFYEKPQDETVEIIDLCERAQRLTP